MVKKKNHIVVNKYFIEIDEENIHKINGGSTKFERIISNFVIFIGDLLKL